MAKTIKKTFSKTKFYKQIAEFDNNLFIFENWKWLSCRHGEKKLLNQEMSSAGIGTADFFL